MAKPLSLPVLHIMLALAGGAKHGYAIKQDVEDPTATVALVATAVPAARASRVDPIQALRNE